MQAYTNRSNERKRNELPTHECVHDRCKHWLNSSRCTKARKDVEKVDNEKVNTFKIITSVPSIKQSITGDSAHLPLVSTTNAPVRKYFLVNVYLRIQ